MTALESDIVTQSFGSGVERKSVHMAKSQVRVSCGGICSSRGAIDGHTQKNRSLVDELIYRPQADWTMTKMESFFNYPQCISRGLKTTNDKFWCKTQCFSVPESGKVISNNVLRSRNKINLGSDGGRNNEINHAH